VGAACREYLFKNRHSWEIKKKISKKNIKKKQKNRFVPRRRRSKMKVKIICKKSFSGFFDYMKKALPSLQKTTSRSPSERMSIIQVIKLMRTRPLAFLMAPEGF
jgi:hypothetical protein